MRKLLHALLVSISFATIGSNYYWVGDAGNWSELNHWATSSGGAVKYTSLPSDTDNVFFDVNSFSLSGQVVSLDTDADCRNLDWSGVTGTPHFQSLGSSNQNSINLHGSLTFVSGMTKTLSKVNFLSTTSGNTVTTGATTNGSTSSFIFAGSGGEWTLQDSLYCGWLRVSSGIVYTGNNNIETRFFFQGSGVGSINLGSSRIHTRVGVKVSGSSFTLNAGTSLFSVSEGTDFDGGGETFYDVLFHEGTNINIKGSNTFNKLTISKSANVNFESGTSQIVSQLEANGTKSDPISLNALTLGSQATISMSSGTFSGDFLTIKDMNATGGATFNANNSVDNGNNTGWNFIPYTPLSYFWVGGTGDWSDLSHWATTTGGSVKHTSLPGNQDNVLFDSNSGSSSDAITIDISNAICGDLTFNSTAASFTVLGSNKLSVYGSLNLATGLDVKAPIVLQSGQTETLTFNSPTNVEELEIFGNGTFNLQDSMVCKSLLISKGTLNSSNYPLYVKNSFWLSPIGPNNRQDLIQFKGGSSNIYTSSLQTDQYWVSAQNVDSSKVNFLKTTLYLQGTSKALAPGGLVLGDVDISGGGLSYFYGSVNGGAVLNNLTIASGEEVIFPVDSSNKTVFNNLLATGTTTGHIEFKSSQAGQQAYLESNLGNNFAGSYLEIQDNHAIGATFLADTSIDFGNNTGWTINTVKSSQTITFDSIPDKTFGDVDFIIRAQSSSGLPVSLSIVTGGSYVSLSNDSNVSILGAGTVRLRASQAGDSLTNPAANVERTFVVQKASQLISFDTIQDKLISDPDFVIKAVSSSGLPVTISIVNSPAVTLSNDTVNIVQAGAVTLRATQSGDQNYISAPFVDRIFNIIDPTVGLGDITTKVVAYFPNPFKSSIHVELGSYAFKPLEVNITNVRGELIQSKRIENARAFNIGQDLSSGLYLITIKSGAKLTSFRVVKE